MQNPGKSDSVKVGGRKYTGKKENKKHHHIWDDVERGVPIKFCI